MVIAVILGGAVCLQHTRKVKFVFVNLFLSMEEPSFKKWKKSPPDRQPSIGDVPGQPIHPPHPFCIAKSNEHAYLIIFLNGHQNNIFLNRF